MSDQKRTGTDAVSRVREMESILDEAREKTEALERIAADLEIFRPALQKLEAYYEGPQWKEDFALDEEGLFPEGLKRGVLSEDGIYNILERYTELLEQIGALHIKQQGSGNGSTEERTDR